MNGKNVDLNFLEIFLENTGNSISEIGLKYIEEQKTLILAKLIIAGVF